MIRVVYFIPTYTIHLTDAIRKQKINIMSSFTKKCNNCGTIISVIEHPMGVPGGKEREEAYCPVCGNIIYSAITDGWFDVGVVSLENTKEPYKQTYLVTHKIY